MVFWPREHGATVMFLASVFLGWGVTRQTDLPTLGMFLALMGVFLVREPLVRIGKGQGRVLRSRLVLTIVLSSSMTLVGGGILLLTRANWWLLALIVAGGLLFVVEHLAAIGRWAWRWWVDVLGVFAAGLAAPAMTFGARAELDLAAGRLYLVWVLFLLGGTLHLRVLLRDGARFRDPRRANQMEASAWSVGSVLVAVALSLVGWLPLGWAVLAAIGLLRPLTHRGVVLDRLPRVGMAESVLTALFVFGLLVQDVTPF